MFNPKAKPPTKVEKERWDIIKNHLGCLACRLDGSGYVPCEIEHLTWFGKRRGHSFTVGLCCWHHRSHTIGTDSRKVCEERMGPSLASNPNAFRERYAKDDDELLYIQNQLIEKWRECNGMATD